MNPKSTANSATAQPLLRFGRGLLAIRDVFHRSGRLDDSNAKLDEIVKLLALEMARLHHPDARLPSLRSVVDEFRDGREVSLVGRLNSLLKNASTLPIFLNADGESLFGENPSFALARGEGSLACELAELVAESL